MVFWNQNSQMTPPLTPCDLSEGVSQQAEAASAPGEAVASVATGCQREEEEEGEIRRDQRGVGPTSGVMPLNPSKKCLSREAECILTGLSKSGQSDQGPESLK